MTYNIQAPYPATLADALDLYDDETMIAVGGSSGYLYIGTKAGFYSDLQHLEHFHRVHRIARAPKLDEKTKIKMPPFVPFLKRKVKEMYMRKSFDEPETVCILIPCFYEIGVWFLSEYAKERERQTQWLKGGRKK